MIPAVLHPSVRSRAEERLFAAIRDEPDAGRGNLTGDVAGQTRAQSDDCPREQFLGSAPGHGGLIKGGTGHLVISSGHGLNTNRSMNMAWVITNSGSIPPGSTT